MLYVHKNNPPRSLTQWRKQNQTCPNRSFDDLPSNVKRDLQDQLVNEQGNICCYTGLRLTESNMHIEHLIPQHQSKKSNHPEQTTDYTNMVTCFNSENFGARKKGEWPETQDQNRFLLIPTNEHHISRIEYTKTGNIKATDKNDQAAKTTISKLNLECEFLKTLRKASITALLCKTISSKDKLKRRLCRLLAQRSEAQIEEFWFIKKQILEKLL